MHLHRQWEQRRHRQRCPGAVIALDTNVRVRYLAQDDARQAAAANRLVEQTLGPNNRGFVSLVTLLETVWVMERRYAADAATVGAIHTDRLDAAAVGRFVQGGVDLHGCLIVGLAEQCKARVVTLDAKAAKRLGMDLLR